ncbi:MAG: hypothetical protein LBB85_05350, partial [Dysgonamonadaceae bacterium]|nr:hypothetical protein [Dysgonamonadaceae bacterium]
TNQTWFYSAWKEDPTIQAMLNMLGGTDVKEKGADITDGLDEIFEGIDKLKFESYWKKLTNEENPSINEILKEYGPTKNYPVNVCPIIFYYLPLDNFGLSSDDLYMNTIILGDIHGFTFWKTAVAENPDCRYVFLSFFSISSVCCLFYLFFIRLWIIRGFYVIFASYETTTSMYIASLAIRPGAALRANDQIPFHGTRFVEQFD